MYFVVVVSFPWARYLLRSVLLSQLPVFQTRQWFLDTAKEILLNRMETKVRGAGQGGARVGHD